MQRVKYAALNIVGDPSGVHDHYDCGDSYLEVRKSGAVFMYAFHARLSSHNFMHGCGTLHILEVCAFVYLPMGDKRKSFLLI